MNDFERLVLELIRELKEDMRQGFERVDKQFEQVDKRFEQVDRQLDEMRAEIRDIKHDIRADRDKLQQVYESRDKVKITFGWQWGLVSLFIATIAAGIVKIFE